MANETKISTIVSKSAFDQLERLDALINKASDSYLVAAKNMAKGLSFDPKSVSELIEKNNQYMSSLKEIQKAETEINRLRQEKNKAIQDGVNEIMAQIKADQEAARIAKEKAKQIRIPNGNLQNNPFLGFKYKKKKHSPNNNSSIKIGR